MATAGEVKLRSILDTTIDGIITIDERGTISSFNAAAETLLGYTAGEAIGKNVSMLMPEPYHGEHDRYLSHYRDTGEAKIIGVGREVEGRRKDGSTFPLELGISEAITGRERFFTGIVRDVTERKLAEQELRSSEKRFRTILQAAPVGIAMADGEGHVLASNPPFKPCSGIPKGSSWATGSRTTFRLTMSAWAYVARAR
jgi:PAS domain S-box-containing protein